jgi:hypothetical protein
LFFLFISLSFSTVSFVILFVFSLIVALVLHLIMHKISNTAKTVPLAGHMSIFFGFVYTVDLFFNCGFLYAY